MDDSYLYGRLSACFGIDVVFLLHKVAGRWSEMPLGVGDLIEVADGDFYKEITIQDVLENTVNNASDCRLGKSVFQDCKVRVKLNSNTTKELELMNKRLKAKELSHLVKWGRITHEEAMEALLKWEADIDV